MCTVKQQGVSIVILTKEAIEKMDEATLRKQVIIPLMEEMGYQGVFEWHGGAGELGKDVVGWKINDLGNRRNLAVVAKSGRISGVKEIATVKTQVAQAFNTPYEDQSAGDKQRIHYCWIVANGRLGKEARSGIRAALPDDQNRDVEILDGNDLWTCVQHYVLVGIHKLLDTVTERLQSSNTPYGIGVEIPSEGRPFVGIEAGGHRIVLTERYPGQLDKEPFILQTLFEFPNTPEGKEKSRELRSALTSGGSAQIPGEYFEVQFPESLENLAKTLFGASPTDASMLHIKPRPSDKRAPVRISIECDDGDTATLDYIEWKVVNSGEDRLVLANDDQSIPIRVVHDIDLKERKTNTTVSLKEGSVAAPLMLQAVKFLHCMAKPSTVNIWLIDPGVPLGSSRSDGLNDEPVDPRFIEVLTDLVVIQKKVGVPIYIPEGEFSEGDLEAISLLRSLLRRNDSSGTWTDLTFGQERESAAATVDAIAKGVAFRVDTEAEVELFGIRIPLGTVRHILKSAQPADESEVRRRIDQGDDVIEIRLVPGNDNRATTVYLDWGDEPASLDNDS